MSEERHPLSYEDAEACFLYDRDTGRAFWKRRPREHFATERGYNVFNARDAGREIKSVNSEGYITVKVFGQMYKMHRIIWLLETGSFPQAEIDHKNRIRHDNRFVNLREATTAENMLNKNKYRRNTSGETGVSWHKDRGKWQANSGKDGKFYYLGLYDDKNEAVRIVKEFRDAAGFSETHGE